MGMTAEEQRAALTILLTACGITVPEYPADEGTIFWQYNEKTSAAINKTSTAFKIQLLNKLKSFFVAENVIKLFDARSDSYNKGQNAYTYTAVVEYLNKYIGGTRGTL